MEDHELVDTIDGVWRSIDEFGAALTEAEWKTPTELPGWSVQDNLVHLSSIEARLLGRPWRGLPDAPGGPHVLNDFGNENEKAVHSRRTWTGAEALAEFHSLTRERVDVLRALDTAGFDADAWTPMGQGTVRSMLTFRIIDAYAHEQDMRRAVAHLGGTASLAADHVLNEMAGIMPFVIGKKAAAPDGSTVVFSLGEPLARTVSIEMVDGRARLTDRIPDQPTTTLTMSTITFERLGFGRVDPEAALAAGDVTIDGDGDLGNRVVGAMNYMF